MGDEPNIAEFQSRIAETRAARGMTLQQVADASGITKGHVWELEKGRSANPTVRAVWSLARALAVSPAYLLGMDDKRSPIDPLALKIAALIDREISARPSPDNQGEG
ncbi:helix-turn-helix domain-containing protein [Stakelama pacifica]|uniref:Helix-turn-helix protein n=1 Tax=Stakelama pacifica TaxID=517720 RepID=A0A4R6FBX7_9SPHN|nr:helix-turn-helix domain-containing protein [Stakelama pacifica]TDN77744.1 helix-turn-helix protein [Stakelama pacifica]GGP00874.1 hypothetical protein GCM10011329_37760 [Stakelama pacifica]